MVIREGIIVPLCGDTVLSKSFLHIMEISVSRENASDDQSCLFASMWKEHTLKRSEYYPDFKGLLRFLYAKHFM